MGVFEGQEGNLYFTYDQSALEQGRYYTAGKLTAWSLLRGGPGLKAIDPAWFLLMCGQDADLEHFRCELLTNREVQKNVLKVFTNWLTYSKVQEFVKGILFLCFECSKPFFLLLLCYKKIKQCNTEEDCVKLKHDLGEMHSQSQYL